MAEQVPPAKVPPPGEAIHLPGPSYVPVIVALGATITLVGVVLNWLVFAAGLAIFIVTILKWIADTRRDISDLPLSHN